MKDFIKKYGSIILGTAILAFGMFNVHVRCDISEGGVLGLSLLIAHWFSVSPGISSPVIDITLFLTGSFLIRRSFLVDSLVASISYALWYEFFEWIIGPILPDLSAYLWLAAVIGAIFVGIGVGLVVRQDCAAGGDDALALIVNHLTGVRVSAVYVVSDTIVLLLSLTYIPARSIVWSFVSVMISSAVIELMRKR